MFIDLFIKECLIAYRLSVLMSAAGQLEESECSLSACLIFSSSFFFGGGCMLVILVPVHILFLSDE